MSLVVLAYPQLEKKDYEWIQSFRAKHDERYFKVVEPHFTVVFPVPSVDEKTLIHHVEKAAKRFNQFYFVLRCAQIVKSSFINYTDVFLIPEEGYRIFVKIHDAMYTGILERELRLDIPFIPHMGVGNNSDAYKSKTYADELNKKNIEIVGSIDSLDIVRYETNSVETIKKVYL